MQRTVSPGRASRIAINLAVSVLAIFCISDIAAADSAGTAPPSTTTTSAPKANLPWAINPPASPWNITDHNWTEFVVTVPISSKITNLRVSHSTIVDSDTGRGKTLPADKFRLCTSVPKTMESCPENAVATELTKVAKGAAEAQAQSISITLWLMVDQDALPNGTFTGNLYLDTEPITETKTLQLTINRTTQSAKFRGSLVILAGVVLAWFITVLARSRINRDQVLLPVELLRQKLSDLQTQLEAVPRDLKADISNTLKEIGSVQNDLSVENLDAQQLLPPSMPAWVQSTTQATAFQAFIQARAQIGDNLNVITTGIQQAANLAATIPPARLQALHTLLQKIDQFATILPQTSTNLQVQIKALFDAWNTTPQAQAVGADGSTQFLVMPAPSPVGIYRIRMEIQTITLLFWAVWGALSILIGFTVVIMPAPGFGTTADYIRCALWGFGLPVTGQGLQTLTMPSLNTQLGVTLPK